ncbi:MAG: leucine-rich repeat domain-containing protein [Oscillospiraceae bacterium]|nr:leucine-rich repeat domain-containing protein [Oscillospiraceae bacterium]
MGKSARIILFVLVPLLFLLIISIPIAIFVIDSNSQKHNSYITIKNEQYDVTLTELYLYRMDLSNADIEPLKYMTKITYLYFWDDQISDISALSGLIKLEWLDLDGNRISDISALSGLVNLERLYLKNNPLTQTQIDELRKMLPDCDIYF